MKKILLFLLLGNLTNLNAQSLQNTIWLGTNPPSPNLWFWFTTDTLYYSTAGNGNYSALSIISSANGQLEIHDLSGIAACTDTGFYSFIINGNQCVFTVINDACVSRRNTLTQYNWLFLSNTGTGLQDVQSSSNEMSVFPNPSTGNLYFSDVAESASLEIYDSKGRLVLITNVLSENPQIDISGLATGLYFIKSGHKSARIIKVE